MSEVAAADGRELVHASYDPVGREATRQMAPGLVRRHQLVLGAEGVALVQTSGLLAVVCCCCSDGRRRCCCADSMLRLVELDVDQTHLPSDKNPH